MSRLIGAAFSRARVVVLLLVMLLGLGSLAYTSIPKEAAPEVAIPVVFVSTGLTGISPEDGERMLVMPLETELSRVPGLRRISASASQGSATLTLEFDAGFDAEEALAAVRRAVDSARPNLPDAAREPVVTELNTALFPILTVVLSGSVPERTLNLLARTLRDRIEGADGVLEAEIGGARGEVVEVLVDPTVFQTYGIGFEELIGLIRRNNQLIAAGTIETGAGRVTLTVPGLIEDIDDVMSMPVLVRDQTVVTFADVATVRRSFEDPTGFARIDGQPALALEVTKRAGANILGTVEAVRAAIAEEAADWPATVRLNDLLDLSKYVDEMLGDLESNVIAAVILVMIVIVAALGLRNALLVGLAIPGAFLTGVAGLWLIGYSMNVVVLFALIFVVGMLVDGAIVTTELADRKLQSGIPPAQAYREAAERMAWPVIAATATTLAVFLPLLFWSGVVGEFMKYLPVTVLFTLGASLAMALVFVPVIGGLIGRARPQGARAAAQLAAAETGDPMALRGLAGLYMRMLRWAVLRPGLTLMLVVVLMAAAFTAYARHGAGVSFFPQIEPDFARVELRARDDLSVAERDGLVRRLEAMLAGMDELRTVYARSVSGGRDEDLIGVVQLELIDWDRRRPAAAIAEEIRAMGAALPGLALHVETQSMGPPTGKPVALELRGGDTADKAAAVARVRAEMARLGGFTDVTDTAALPGLEWRLTVNRAEAARLGADVALLGQAVQLLTQGITVADFRPGDTDETLDIRIRFPEGSRTLEDLQTLRVPTRAGSVPVSAFVTLAPAPRTGTLRRIDQARVVTVEANVAPGFLAAERIAALDAALAGAEGWPPRTGWSFAGEAREQAEAQGFLGFAFLGAVSLMFLILLIQFNSFAQAAIVMSAIVFSTAGVLLGLLVTGRPFGVVMGGVGMIALAGIVVNNNIVLIDTFNALRREGQPPLEAVLRTGAQRLRPVLLTSLTTALGLMPMVIGLNVDFLRRIMVLGAPSTQWWTELSAAIVGGLTVATLLTLIVTPALLMLTEGRGPVPRPGRAPA